MIPMPAQVFVATAPINLGLSFDRLAGIVREQLGGDPRGNALFVFHNRRRTHIKALWHNGKSYCLLYVRLDRGTYRIPAPSSPEATSVEVSDREFRLFLEGLDAQVLRRARRTVAELDSSSLLP